VSTPSSTAYGKPTSLNGLSRRSKIDVDPSQAGTQMRATRSNDGWELNDAAIAAGSVSGAVGGKPSVDPTSLPSAGSI